jgi:hypothetical protein
MWALSRQMWIQVRFQLSLTKTYGFKFILTLITLFITFSQN